MQINNSTPQINPNFKAVYANEKALKYLKCDLKQIENLPVIKKYSKDMDIIIRGETDNELELIKESRERFITLLSLGSATLSALVLSVGLLRSIIVCGLTAFTAISAIMRYRSTDGTKCTIQAAQKGGPMAPNLDSPKAKLYNHCLPWNRDNEICIDSLDELNSDGMDKCLDLSMMILGSTPLIEYFKKEPVNCFEYFMREKIPSNVPPLKMYEFLMDITRDKELAPKLAEEISHTFFCDTADRLKNMLGENLYNIWLKNDEIGYRKAYNDYYNKVYDECKNPMELIKISPNLAPWALKQKFKELDIEPVLGKLPNEFGSHSMFRGLISRLQALNVDIHSSDKDKKFPPNEDGTYTIKHGNNTYKIEPQSKGLSAKLVFKVTPQDSYGISYFLKFVPYKVKGQDYKSTKIRENYDLRGDTPYLNAMVDFYMKLNHTPFASDILFYDTISQAVVYEETKGEVADPKEVLKIINKSGPYYKNYYKILKNHYGISINDIAADNFIKTPDGKIVIIDSGHATFQHDLKPLVTGKQITLSNLCGRD